MKSILSALTLALMLSVGHAWADAKSDCEAKAVSKDGKPLAGAAKDAKIKSCMKDAGAAAAPAAPAADAKGACEAKAIDKNGKALHGAAKEANMKKCLKDSAAKK